MKTVIRTVLTAAAVMGVTSGALAAPRTATLQIKNVSCVTCVPIVKRTLSRVSGVTKVAVVEKAGIATATVSFDDAKVAPAALAAAASEAGYPAVVKGVR
ncbi:cation transporter [Sphingopyxis sp. SE2]|uniref:cation transporter n=1 Tax=Sphingopyxis sp. SE2 TaxID=1586240 RepID=UPI0028C0B3D3|nr:cation transporter [Sphingopyxis sp. SE2]MDT7531280.1 cation transporter [Sphingopyxis sp. SE2]